MKIMKHRPCPMCGNDDVKYIHHEHYGQGDCTYECLIQCKCGMSYQTDGGWGGPPDDAEEKAWFKWENLERK